MEANLEIKIHSKRRRRSGGSGAWGMKGRQLEEEDSGSEVARNLWPPGAGSAAHPRWWEVPHPISVLADRKGPGVSCAPDLHNHL